MHTQVHIDTQAYTYIYTCEYRHTSTYSIPHAFKRAVWSLASKAHSGSNIELIKCQIMQDADFRLLSRGLLEKTLKDGCRRTLNHNCLF